MTHLCIRRILIGVALTFAPGPVAGQTVVYDPSNYTQNALQAARAPGSGRLTGDRRLPADRSADRLVSRALHRECPVASGRPGDRPPELAFGLRLHHRQGRRRAQRLCPRERSVRQGRESPGRSRHLERDPCLERQLPGRLDRTPLREREPRCDRAMDRDPDRRFRYAARRRTAAQESTRRVRPRYQLVEGARLMRSRSFAFMLLMSTAFTGCATFKPPLIGYDDEQPAVLQADPPKPVQVVELPKPLPLPGQLKPLPGARSAPEPRDPRQRVDVANAAARVQPSRAGYVNAVQVFPFAEGALYQVYASPGQVTDIALQESEQLVGSGPVAAGDTVRWIIGATESGPANAKRVHILVKPTRPDVITNLVINTDRRTYHMELRSTEKTSMASGSWINRQDQLITLA